MHPDGKAHGGSAILINNKIRHYQSVAFCQEEIQATSVVVEDCHSALTVTALYCPPKHKIREEQFTTFFKSLGNRFIAGGDFNAKHTFWGSRLILTRGRELLKATETLNLGIISSGQPTYWPTDNNKVPDLIDFCISKGIPKKYVKCESSLELSSDHSPVIVELFTRVNESTKNCTLHNRKTDWIHFRELVSTALEPKLRLKSEEDLIAAVEHFNTSIQNAAWESTQSIGNSDTYMHTSKSILEKVSKKRKLRKQWQTTRCPILKNRLNHAIKDLKHTLIQDRNDSVEAHLSKLDATASTDYSLWKATRKLKQPTVVSQPLRRTDGSWARSEYEKASTFAEHLIQVFQPHPYEGPPEHKALVRNALNGVPEDAENVINKFTKQEVLLAIKTVNSKKSPGYDLITGRILQELPDAGVA